ncbi:MAG: alpha/beta hydrolase, partial [Bacteroidales bacterium]|nr:alpha/beta hydrolase [Bacteroidales bacterium]
VYDHPVPFLFIIGKQDSKADVPKLMAQSLLPQQAYVQTLPCGHMGMYECPAQTEAMVREFANICFFS